MTGRDTALYVSAAVLRRRVETAAAIVAVALTVAFLAALGSFTGQTGSRLSIRAGEQVPVDWQVQVVQGGDQAGVRKALADVPGFIGERAVDYAKVPGLESASASGRRTTGLAYVVSWPADYQRFAPSEIRNLLGNGAGALLQQQTAANLAAGAGANVTVLGPGHSVQVGGIVDLPNAESLFQVIGAPPGSAAGAAPDNVLLVPPSSFASLTAGSPVVHQFHVRIDHRSLSSDPAKAADEVTQRANHYLTSVAGGALIGDNLAAALTAAREDALYARLLVLLLGIPGLVLSGVVTALVISLRNDRQRRDLALLRLRGATPRRVTVLFGLVALADGLLGAAAGAAGALIVTRLALGPGAQISASWLAASALTGVTLAVLIELTPVARLLRGESPTVNEQAQSSMCNRNPLPLRLGLDAVLLAGSVAVFWLTSRGGYQVVVVPEGVPVASVNYAALLAPALAWPGMALLVWRLTALSLSRRTRPLLSDPSGAMADLRRDGVRRRRQLIARGATGLAVAIAVTLSTAVFTSTYDQQARLDTALTVGADVAVTLPPDSTSSLSPTIARKPGALAVEQVAHRLAYVGPDLQDVYGVDPSTIARAAPMQNAFTPGSSITDVFKLLASTSDGALISQETLHDYQLRTGDTIRLRLKNQAGAYALVSFHIVGVITEFATAPRDSFVVANRSYLARATGRTSVQTLLVRTDAPAQLAASIHPPSGAVVNDITAPKVAVPSASGLAAGSLAGLARLNLTFGLLLAAASAGLVLLTGALQRRRSQVALAVIGATARQRAGFLWTEGRWIIGAGILGGLLTGALIAQELIKVLNWIFDPPPQHPAIPLLIMVIVVTTVAVAGAAAIVLAATWAGKADPSQLRDL